MGPKLTSGKSVLNFSLFQFPLINMMIERTRLGESDNVSARAHMVSKESYWSCFWYTAISICKYMTFFTNQVMLRFMMSNRCNLVCRETGDAQCDPLHRSGVSYEVLWHYVIISEKYMVFTQEKKIFVLPMLIGLATHSLWNIYNCIASTTPVNLRLCAVNIYFHTFILR